MHGHKATDITGLDPLPDSILNDTSTRLIAGSDIWVSGLNFSLSNLKYQILGEPYTAPDGPLTHDAADATNPRIDVHFADVFGNIGILKGTPAANPLKPLVNPATQIELSMVYIPAGATVPGTYPGSDGLVTEVIYNENTEWTTSKTEDANTSINFESLVNPSKDLKCIAIAMNDAGASGAWVRSIMETGPARSGPLTVNVANAITTWDCTPAQLFADHKTDAVSGLIRHLIYYRIKTRNQIKAAFRNLSTGVIYYLSCTGYSNETFAVAELGFSVRVPDTVNFKTSINGVPAGNYEVSVTGFEQCDQNYLGTPVTLFTPSTLKALFTRSAVIDAKGGNIALDLITSKTFLSGSGLLLELWNGADLVGSKALLPSVNFYGFNPDLSGEWQRITVPVADFNPTTTIIDGFSIRPINEYPNDVSLGIDNIVLQTGGQTGSIEPERIEEISFEYRDVTEAGQVYTLDLLAYYGYKVLGATLKTDAGTVTLDVTINTADVTGLKAIVADATTDNFAATGANIVQEGDVLTLEIGAVTGATALIGKIKLVRV